MAEQARGGASTPQQPEGLGPGEKEQLAYALETRYTPHLEAAATAVRQAEQDLAEARDNLARAELAVEREEYRSDPLVFMREGVNEEVEGLERKTTPKKVRASYRFLLDRAVELAAGEVQRFHDDEAAAQQEREHGVQASQAAVHRAVETLEAARLMQDRVRAAERAARQGLAVLVDKLTAEQPEP